MCCCGSRWQRFREEGFDRSALDVDSENPTGALRHLRARRVPDHQRWTDYRLERRSGRAESRRRRRSARSRVRSRANGRLVGGPLLPVRREGDAVAGEAPPQPLVVGCLDPDQHRVQAANRRGAAPTPSSTSSGDRLDHDGLGEPPASQSKRR